MRRTRCGTFVGDIRPELARISTKRRRRSLHVSPFTPFSYRCCLFHVFTFSLSRCNFAGARIRLYSKPDRADRSFLDIPHPDYMASSHIARRHPNAMPESLGSEMQIEKLRTNWCIPSRGYQLGLPRLGGSAFRLYLTSRLPDLVNLPARMPYLPAEI